MSIVYLNGQFMPLSDAKISVMDRGFLLGDSVYEVIPVYQSKPFRLQEHVRRLHASLAAVRLCSPLTDPQWVQLFDDLIQKNGGGELSLYLQITRGAAPVRDHAFPTDETQPTVFAMTNPMAVSLELPKPAGKKAIVLADIRWLRCDIKATALLANVLLRQQAIEQQAQESILIREGVVTEGAATNVFVVKNQVLITPAKTPLILGGITRDLVVELAKANGLVCEERTVKESELYTADEIWLSSSTKEILPIVQLDEHVVADGCVGPMWHRMTEFYLHYKRSLFVD